MSVHVDWGRQVEKAVTAVGSSKCSRPVISRQQHNANNTMTCLPLLLLLIYLCCSTQQRRVRHNKMQSHGKTGKPRNWRAGPHPLTGLTTNIFNKISQQLSHPPACTCAYITATAAASHHKQPISTHTRKQPGTVCLQASNVKAISIGTSAIKAGCRAALTATVQCV